MRATLLSFEIKEYKNKENGKPFKSVIYKVFVEERKKIFTGSVAYETLKEYFTLNKIDGKSQIGCEVEVTISKEAFKTENGVINYEKAKYLKILDIEGNPIEYKETSNYGLDF